MFVDSHCHIDFSELSENLPEVLQNMKNNAVTHAMVIGVSKPRFAGIMKIVEASDNLFATVGVHPDNPEAENYTVQELVDLAQHPKVVGIGETGLDYHWCKGDMTWQHERFKAHIEAANIVGLPLVVHTRESVADTLDILKAEGADRCLGVMHCFTESWEWAQKSMELGFYISMSGIVTFKNAAQVKEVALNMPLDRLLIETDSPYLAPIPFRGKLNQPAYVKHVAEYIAQLRGISVEELAKITSDNYFNLFKKAIR